MSVPSQKPRRVGRSCVAAEAAARAGYWPGGTKPPSERRSKVKTRQDSRLADLIDSRKPSGTVPRSSPTTAHCWRQLSRATSRRRSPRSEEHTSELQSLAYLV